MRRLITVLFALVFALLVLPTAPASTAKWKSCGSSHATIGTKNYVIAIKIKAKGISCTGVKDFWNHFGTGEMGDAVVEDLRAHCKHGSKAQQKAAAKKNRFSYVCKSGDGSITTAAWVLGG